MKRLNFLLVALALVIVTACGNGEDDANNANAYIETEEDQQAYDIYRQNCLTCHATDLSGQMGAKSNLQKVGDRLSEADIEETIRNGKGAMPKFGDRLSDDDINLLATWLAARK